MAIVRLKKFIEDVASGAADITSDTAAYATSSGNAGTALKATSSGQAGTSFLATSATAAGTAFLASSANYAGTAQHAYGTAGTILT